MPTAEETVNEATYRRCHDAANTRDLDRHRERDRRGGRAGCADQHAGAPDDAPATQALRQVWATLYRAFPDLVVTNEELIAHDDKELLARNAVTGTNDGEYMGRAAHRQRP